MPLLLPYCWPRDIGDERFVLDGLGRSNPVVSFHNLEPNFPVLALILTL